MHEAPRTPHEAPRTAHPAPRTAHRALRTLLALFAAGLLSGIAPGGGNLSALGGQTPGADDAAAEARRANNVGVGYMNQQRFEEALKYFQQATRRDPQFATAQLNEGIALMNLQRDAGARDLLRELTRRHPDDVRAWYNLGLAEKNLGKSEGALEAFRRAADLDPTDPDTHYFAGLMAGQLQRHAEAVEHYESALRQQRYHASAQFGLARAWQRLGDTERAREHLERFQQVTQDKLGTPMGQAYGDQGPYSLAATSPADSAVPDPIPVRFVPVEDSGLPAPNHRTPTPDSRTPNPQSRARAAGESDAARYLGAGACAIDVDRDGLVDLLLIRNDRERPLALYRNAGGGRFVDRTDASGLDAPGVALGCAAGDYDNDGWTDLAVSFVGRVALFRNRQDGTFEDVTDAAGIRTDGLPLGVTFVDYDHDGDLDLYVSRLPAAPPPPDAPGFPFGDETAGANVLWRNNGNGTFTDVTGDTALAGAAPGVAAVVSDVDNDRAIDFVLTGRRPQLLLNPREGAFEPVDAWPDPVPPTAGALVFDFDKDGWMDVAFTHWEAPGLTLWRNVDGRRFERVDLPIEGWTRGWGLTALDHDNDGWLDLAAVGERDGEARLVLLRNAGLRGFVDHTAAAGLDQVALTRPRALLAADYDGDGGQDLIVTQNDGSVVLLRNDGAARHSWLSVALEGLVDNRSAIGTKLEVFAGALWQKQEVHGASGYLGQGPLTLHTGLGRAGEAEIVRMLWPTGVLQDEVEIPAREPYAVTQIDRRGSSCPVLFTWNGERYEFIADAIGPGILGHWAAPGVRNTPDPTEYVKVPGSTVVPRHGRLSFRFAEPMEEVIYLDQVRLLAIDSPPGVEVYPNERFAAVPPFPEHRVITSRDARRPAGAWDARGRDVMPELRHRDRWYVESFESMPFKGFAEPHVLELDLGEIDPEAPLRLLMHGLTDYFTANSIFAAHQADVHPVVPYVDALVDGRWVRISDDIGFPAGLARTMVADLTGLLPPGARRIRIGTNLKIYWDQILIDTTPDGIPVRETEVPLVEASLSFRGYPREITGSPEADLRYAYDEVSPTGPFARHAGAYTRYGDVLRLLTDVDDRFVIFGSGEEVALEFDPAGLPPLPEGWTRDYFFFAHGYAKDMDFYAAYATTVEPLPFEGMPAYPYPDSHRRLGDPSFVKYLLERNDRKESGRGGGAFRFQFDPPATAANRGQ